jgi:lipopolysaccharide export system protein LptA
VAPVPPAHAQGTALGFGGLRQNPDAPVEVTSDRFEVNQADGVAIFTGNVVVVQGELRLGAGAVRVEYGDGGSGIRRLHASGGVTLATSAEAAESREAVYTLASGELEMSGDVLVTQGAATIAGDRLVADLRAGTGRIEGRVKTVFRPGLGGGAAGGD